MTAPLNTFSNVIALWERLADFARDIDEPYENARQWRLNDSIPARAFGSIVGAAAARGFGGVTLELLCSFAAGKHELRRAEERDCA